jgi:hypothetical protein
MTHRCGATSPQQKPFLPMIGNQAFQAGSDIKMARPDELRTGPWFWRVCGSSLRFWRAIFPADLRDVHRSGPKAQLPAI